MTDLPYERLALADDLHLTWHAHLLTVASARWSPGAFLYDLEYLTVEVKSKGDRVKIVIGSRGPQILFQVLRFDLDLDSYRRFEGLVGRMRAHRDLLGSESL